MLLTVNRVPTTPRDQNSTNFGNISNMSFGQFSTPSKMNSASKGNSNKHYFDQTEIELDRNSQRGRESAMKSQSTMTLADLTDTPKSSKLENFIIPKEEELYGFHTPLNFEQKLISITSTPIKPKTVKFVEEDNAMIKFTNTKDPSGGIFIDKPHILNQGISDSQLDERVELTQR